MVQHFVLLSLCSGLYDPRLFALCAHSSPLSFSCNLSLHDNLRWTEREGDGEQNSCPPALIGSVHLKGVINDLIRWTLVQIIHQYSLNMQRKRLCKSHSLQENSPFKTLQWAGCVGVQCTVWCWNVTRSSGCRTAGFWWNSHLPFLIRPLSLWNVTCREKKKDRKN